MGVKYVYRRPPLYHPTFYYGRFCWWLWWVLIFGFLATLIVLAATAPHHSHYYYYKSLDGNASKRKACTASETFDADLGLCKPNVNLPVPIEADMMDRSINQCTSFYDFMCGSWIRNHTNENRAFTYVYRKNLKQVHDIIKDPASGPIYDFYRSCLDTIVLGQHAFESSQQTAHVMEHILGALRTHADLPVVFARLAKFGFNSPFSVVIEHHPTRPRMIPLFRFDNVADLDTPLTRQLNTWHAVDEANVNFVDYVLGPNFKQDVIPFKVLEDLAPANFWAQYFREINSVPLKLDRVWVMDRGYFEKLLKHMASFSVKEWKEFVRASVLHNMENFIPAVPSDSYFRSHEAQPVFVEHRLKSSSDFSEDHCLAVTHKLLPGLIAKEFLHRDMPHGEQIRAQVTELVKNLRNAFAQIINETPWLNEYTRHRAVEKIRSMIVRAVHPNTWETEPFAQRITRDRYLRNPNFIRRYRVQRNLQLWEATSRDVIQRFGAPLTTVNAYYSPSTNTITVFAGIIRKPFYSRRYSPAAQYASLGMIVGHELSHGLDPTGRLFDESGSLTKWWTDADMAEFDRRAQCVIDEYGPPAGCQNANYGKQTLGEDVADITGLTVAYRAFLNAYPAATINEKREFFEVFAQMWAESYDQEHLCGRVKNDVHSIAWYRVDRTLRQIGDFAKLFGCKAGDKMVNSKKCTIYGKE
jgi:predicted metalloendopeptidase